jgi:hypothetical protein
MLFKALFHTRCWCRPVKKGNAEGIHSGVPQKKHHPTYNCQSALKPYVNKKKRTMKRSKKTRTRKIEERESEIKMKEKREKNEKMRREK